MRKHTILLSVAAAAVALSGAVAVPMATAGESEARAGRLDCSAKWEDGIRITCYYQTVYRGQIHFDSNYEPEILSTIDGAKDHRGVIAHVWWSQDGKVRHREVRDATGNGAVTSVAVPDGSEVTVAMCLDGGYCGKQYHATA